MDEKIHNLIFIGKLRPHYRWSHIIFAIKALWNALKGYHIEVECLETPCQNAFAEGMKAGMEARRGMNQGHLETIDELATALIAAGKILEKGYYGKDPTHPDFQPAWKAYEIIHKVMEDSPL